MKYREAFKKAGELNCPETIVAAVENVSKSPMNSNAEAGILCKRKIRSNFPNDLCYVMNGRNCPLGKD